METAAGTLLFTLNRKIINYKQSTDAVISNISSNRACSSIRMRYNAQPFHERASYIPAVSAISSGAEDIQVSSSQCKDFSVTATSINDDKDIKMTVEVSGVKTQAIFDNVFSKMVADAQPIPGFRRVKGGKTPNIPRDILLEVLGPSKVYKQVIKKVINHAISEYVEKEGLIVSKDLRIEQSFEDLEAKFEPGDRFCFDAVVVRVQETK
ncbi:uncharacterized protein LOC131151594 isoform X1 [Malania oleifera]|uniref:uncharacterized protein LOC131151594 isoform X1 n=1 Tax=Malania oleifera TaxID=397392 RepID=UPI0025AEB600|nr:uncharacterized protein LOC131151594 isoform X1 [Malania oleifera]